MNKSRQAANLWLPVLACMIFIFYVSSKPGKEIPFLFPRQDIVFHISVYFLLAFSFCRAFKNTYADIVFWKLIFFSVVFCVFYGITDELHQLFVPGRSCSGFDVFMDGIGSFIGSSLYTFAASKSGLRKGV